MVKVLDSLLRRVRYGKRIVPDYASTSSVGAVATTLVLIYLDNAPRASGEGTAWKSFHYWTRNISLDPQALPGEDRSVPTPEITSGLADLSSRYVTRKEETGVRGDGWTTGVRSDDFEVGSEWAVDYWLGAVYATLVMGPDMRAESGRHGVPAYTAAPLACDDFGVVRLLCYLLSGNSLAEHDPGRLLSRLESVGVGSEDELLPGDLLSLRGSSAMHVYVGDKAVLTTDDAGALTLTSLDKVDVTRTHRGLVRVVSGV